MPLPSQTHGAVKLLGEGGSGTFTLALQRDPAVDATITVKAVGFIGPMI